MSNNGEKTTLVEEGTQVVGTIRASCPVVVRGSVEGDLEAPVVSVTETGTVQGNVKATRVQSHGSLAGAVEADEISLAGEVKSNTVIRAKSLEVKLRAEKGRLEVTFGDCLLDVGETPGKDATVEDTSSEAGDAEPTAAADAEPAAAVAATASPEAERSRDKGKRNGQRPRRGDGDDAESARAEGEVAVVEAAAEPAAPA